MKTFFLPLILSPLLSLAQSNRTADVANPVQIKSYSTSAGTFTIERSSATESNTVPDEIDFIESTEKTSDGGTSTLVLNKDAYEESMENLIAENEIQVTILPNPFNTTANFIINTDEDVHKAIFEIYDVFGRMVKSMPVQTLSFLFDNNNLSDGFYLYRIKIYNENGEEKTASGKFIINSNQ
ncbi:MAG: T9SS type A sorting domain-containing protein [Bacteroidetes bacterium]|nr:T9SS type A sorting domain-containing protein [Bacteroidota bacterium]